MELSGDSSCSNKGECYLTTIPKRKLQRVLAGNKILDDELSLFVGHSSTARVFHGDINAGQGIARFPVQDDPFNGSGCTFLSLFVPPGNGLTVNRARADYEDHTYYG